MDDFFKFCGLLRISELYLTTLLGRVFGPWISPLIMAKHGRLGNILPEMMLNVKNISEFMPSDVENELRGMIKSYAQQSFPKVS